MSRMTILTEADLRKIVRLDAEAVTCVENAFRALATLPVAMFGNVEAQDRRHRHR